MKRFGLRAMKWPLSSNDVKAYLETTARHKAMFTLALALDDMGLSCAIRADIAKVHGVLLQLQSEQTTLVVNGRQQNTNLRVDLLQLQSGQDAFILDERRQIIHYWLSAPDLISNHHSARKKQQATTGAWLVDGDQFATWRVQAHYFLWLYGIRQYNRSTIQMDQTDSMSQLVVARLYYGWKAKSVSGQPDIDSSANAEIANTDGIPIDFNVRRAPVSSQQTPYSSLRK
ncbi:hypothetical protein MMC15_001623, partial [Xylographa vitiligo]|nr:hypothetical protein [Xylographa vitiligo]